MIPRPPKAGLDYRFPQPNTGPGARSGRSTPCPRATSVAVLVSCAVFAACSLLVPQPADALGPGTPFYQHPSRWVPSFVYAEMGYESYGNVQYLFQWDLERSPSSVQAWENPGASGGLSLEIGYKNTGGDNCHQLPGGLNGSAGIPAGVYIGPDFTEERTDAVLFVSDMEVVAADQRANPTKMYGAWWDCDGSFNPNGGPVYNLQLGDGSRPLVSDSVAQLNYVPAEHGSRGFPGVNPTPGAHASTWMFGPWTMDWNFEDGSEYWKHGDDNWSTFNANKQRNCNQYGPVDGVCYDFVWPAASGAQALFYQRGSVFNSVAPEGQPVSVLSIGTNTGFQYEGLFRCPPGHNVGVCGIDVWLKGSNRGWNAATDKTVYNIPADNQWYSVLRDSFPVGGSTVNFDLYIGSYAKIDVDAQWVSSGL